MVLEVSHLTVALTDDPDVEILHDVALRIGRGETLALVGGSGSGKSTFANTVLGLLPSSLHVTGGSIRLNGEELTEATESRWLTIRGAATGLVPQDPLSNLDPLFRIGRQVEEAVVLHQKVSRSRASETALDALGNAGLANSTALSARYPHQLSGGQRQRVLIAMGTANHPDLLVADEPTSALDVTVQRRILDRLQLIQRETGMAILLITHDLRIAAERADRVVVLNRGRIVETGQAREVFAHPRDPYSRSFVAAVTDAPVTREPGRGDAQEDHSALLTLEHVGYTYPGSAEPALDDVSVTVRRGRTLALVGESGSGKTTLTKAVLNLLSGHVDGRLVFDGIDVRHANRAERSAYRRRVRMIYQDPGSSLDPARTVAATLVEPLRSLGTASTRAPSARRAVVEALTAVGLGEEYADRLPRELSGGQKQRVAIARALITKPDLVVCDEPTSTLDVLVQHQVLDLLARLQAELGVGYLFITHDLAIARSIAHEVAVMHEGRIVDFGETERVFTSPGSDYTRELLDAIPAFAA